LGRLNSVKGLKIVNESNDWEYKKLLKFLVKLLIIIVSN